jgi:pantetheine-phosphate adenylyltransferase
MRIAVCPGSYDPITLGHVNIISRAAKVFDRVVVLVMQNHQKPCVFPLGERARIARVALSGLDNVAVDESGGLFADYAKRIGAAAVVKGVRTGGDFDYERTIAAVNASLGAPETVLIPCAPEYFHVSTSTALHLYKMGADVSAYLPEESIKALKAINY